MCLKHFEINTASVKFGASTKCNSCASLLRNKRYNIKCLSVYRKWGRMINRCYNKSNTNYHAYGAKGILVCDEWKDFHTFQDWVLSFGNYIEGTHIDRIDNSGNYSQDNCQLLSTSEHALKTWEFDR